MDTERNILKQISENKGKASVQLIAKGLRLRNDYIRYLCLELIKRGLVKRLKSRDWYKITRKGEKEIGKLTEKPPKKHIFAKKKRKRRKKIKRSIKKRAKSPLFTHRKKTEKPARNGPKTKAKKAATQPEQKLKRLWMFPEKVVSGSETVLEEETSHPEELEASKEIETLASPKTNKITEFLKLYSVLKENRKPLWKKENIFIA